MNSDDQNHLDIPDWDMRSHKRTWPGDSKILAYYAQLYEQVFLAYHLPHKINSQKVKGDLPSFFHVTEMPPSNLMPPEITEQSVAPFEIKLTSGNARALLSEKYDSTVMTLEQLKFASTTTNDRDALRALTDDPYEFPITPEDKQRHDKLDDFCQAHSYFHATCCEIPTYMQTGISQIFADCGVERVHVAAQGEDAEFALNSLIDKLPWQFHLGNNPIEAVYDQDGTLLVVHEAHNLCSLICGKGKVLRKTNIESRFEGFWCDENTTVRWNWKS